MASIFDLFKQIEKPKDTSPVSFIIAGLGNPGGEYEKTRHNVGFLAVDYIAERCGVRIDRAKFHALVTEASIGGVRTLLMKPTTYMNNSGTAVAEAASFYKISPERILVLHDEISFEPGLFRIRRRGSAGGHNGLKSIIAHLGSEEFARVKIGVGKKPTPEYDLADWVLGTLPAPDLASIKERFSDVFSTAELVANGKIDDAMSRFSK